MQSRRHSALETALSTAIGFVVAFLANLVILPAFGYTPSFSDNFLITCFFTAVSLVRGYCVRRFFNWLHWKELL